MRAVVLRPKANAKPGDLLLRHALEQVGLPAAPFPFGSVLFHVQRVVRIDPDQEGFLPGVFSGKPGRGQDRERRKQMEKESGAVSDGSGFHHGEACQG